MARVTFEFPDGLLYYLVDAGYEPPAAFTDAVMNGKLISMIRSGKRGGSHFCKMPQDGFVHGRKEPYFEQHSSGDVTLTFDVSEEVARRGVGGRFGYLSDDEIDYVRRRGWVDPEHYSPLIRKLCEMAPEMFLVMIPHGMEVRNALIDERMRKGLSMEDDSLHPEIRKLFQRFHPELNRILSETFQKVPRFNPDHPIDMGILWEKGSPHPLLEARFLNGNAANRMIAALPAALKVEKQPRAVGKTSRNVPVWGVRIPVAWPHQDEEWERARKTLYLVHPSARKTLDEVRLYQDALNAQKDKPFGKRIDQIKLELQREG